MILSVFPALLWIRCRRYRLVVILYPERRLEWFRAAADRTPAP